MKQSLLFPIAFFSTMYVIQALPMARSQSLDLAKITADTAYAQALNIEKLKEEAQKCTASKDIPAIYTKILELDKAHWTALCKYSIENNSSGTVRNKLRALAILLLPKLDNISEICIIEFLELFEKFPKERLREDKNQNIVTILSQLKSKIYFSKITNILNGSRTRWLTLFSQSFDNLVKQDQQEFLKIVASLLCSKIKELTDTDLIFLDLFQEKALSTFGSKSKLDNDFLAIFKTLEDIKKKTSRPSITPSPRVSVSSRDDSDEDLEFSDDWDTGSSGSQTSASSSAKPGAQALPTSPALTPIAQKATAANAPRAKPAPPARTASLPQLKAVAEEKPLSKPAAAGESSSSVQSIVLPEKTSTQPKGVTPATSKATEQVIAKPAATSESTILPSRWIFNIAKSCFNSGKYKRARQLFSQLSEQESDLEIQAAAVKRLKNLRNVDDITTSFTRYARIFQSARPNASLKLEAQHYLENMAGQDTYKSLQSAANTLLGDMYYRQSDITHAEAYYKKTIELGYANKAANIRARTALAMIYSQHEHNIDKALNIIKATIVWHGGYLPKEEDCTESEANRYFYFRETKDSYITLWLLAASLTFDKARGITAGENGQLSKTADDEQVTLCEKASKILLRILSASCIHNNANDICKRLNDGQTIDDLVYPDIDKDLVKQAWNRMKQIVDFL